MEQLGKMLKEGDSIQIHNPVKPKGRQHCEACGRFVDCDVIVLHARRPNTYVCNVMCGLKVVDAT